MPRTPREISFKYDGERFFIREPGINDINTADLIRSQYFFKAIKEGVATEEEIITALEEQKRFSQKAFETKTDKMAIEIQMAMTKIAKAESGDQLTKAFDECKATREAWTEHINKRQTFVQHAAETKAGNEHYVALMSVCVLDSKHKQVFGELDPITQTIDIKQAYDTVRNYEDFAFISTCLQQFVPFANGILNPTELDPEYILYEETRKKLKLPEDKISEEIKALREEEEKPLENDKIAKIEDISSRVEESKESVLPTEAVTEAAIAPAATKAVGSYPPGSPQPVNSVKPDVAPKPPTVAPAQLRPEAENNMAEDMFAHLMPTDSALEPPVLPTPLPQPPSTEPPATEPSPADAISASKAASEEETDDGRLSGMTAANDTNAGDGSGTPAQVETGSPRGAVHPSVARKLAEATASEQ